MLNHQYDSISSSPKARSRETVVMHFRQIMLQMTQSFISTQQPIMLCYLQEESPNTWGTNMPVHASSRQFRHLNEPSVKSESLPSDKSGEASLRVFGFSQQSVLIDQNSARTVNQIIESIITAREVSSAVASGF